jgi:hypothetical protein
VHIGNVACDENAFRQAVQRIADDEHAYWIGMGDYCDFINMHDPRFSPGSLAEWVTISHLGDLAKAQQDRFVEFVKPIAPKCLALLSGNHETSILKHYERDVYANIVTAIKQMSGRPADYPLGMGFSGWLRLVFYWAKNKKGGSSMIDVYTHHGYTGGKLAGAKALDMQRALWNHDADLIIFGHSHNMDGKREAVETVDKGDAVKSVCRLGVYGGTFLHTNVEGATTYSEFRGYPPLPVGHVEIILTPGRERKVSALI